MDLTPLLEKTIVNGLMMTFSIVWAYYSMWLIVNMTANIVDIAAAGRENQIFVNIPALTVEFCIRTRVTKFYGFYTDTLMYNYCLWEHHC